MTARRAILYCTVNGVCNNTNGLGRQTKTLLSALARHGEELTRLLGGFDVQVACPQPGPDTWAFNPADLAFSQQVVAPWSGLGSAASWSSEGKPTRRACRSWCTSSSWPRNGSTASP